MGADTVSEEKPGQTSARAGVPADVFPLYALPETGSGMPDTVLPLVRI